MHQKLSQQRGMAVYWCDLHNPRHSPSLVNYPVMRAKKTYRAISAIKAGSLRA